MSNELQLSFSRAPGAGGVSLHYAAAGPADGPLVFLLHGFPEFWFGWRHQIEPLAAAGFRVIAPDQRGYNLSDKPKDLTAYALDVLTEDVLALADGFGRSRFAVAGHDWGAAVGWWLATHHPDRVERLAALSAPHPAVWLEAQKKNPKQRRKSWYAYFFRLPRLPELVLGAGNFHLLAKSLREAARKDAFSGADVERYRQAWAVPGALTAMLNWYRAAVPGGLGPPGAYRVRVPTMILWGAREAYAIRELAQQSRQMCDRAELIYFEEATHWVQHDEPERVTALLREFLV